MKILIFLTLTFFSVSVFAVDGEQTGYFGALWDFIDWVYEAFDNFKQSVVDFLAEIGKVLILWYIKWKIWLVEIVWTAAQAYIDTLNLSNVINSAFSFLSPDVKYFLTELRIGEGVNLIISAHVTRSTLRMLGW